jgi:hypothetical protein
MIDNLIRKTRQPGNERILGFLYDIGCNIEKGIIRVSFPSDQSKITYVINLKLPKQNQFPEERGLNLSNLAQAYSMHMYTSGLANCNIIRG